MKKSLISSLLVLLALCLFTAPALALDNAWDSWQPEDNSSYIRLTCPEWNIGYADLFGYVQELIAKESGELGADYACYQVRFPYASAYRSASQMERVFYDEFAPLVRMLWPSTSTVTWGEALLSRSESVSYLSVNLHLNGRSAEPSALTEKITELADAAHAAAADQRGQLEYVNQWLVDNVAYGGGANSRSSAGALLEGQAVCQGYASAVMDVCRLLDVPCLYIGNGSHGWNCVYVDGQWLMWDVTWNDLPGKNGRYFLVDEISGTDSHSYDRDLLARGQEYALSSKRPAPSNVEPVAAEPPMVQETEPVTPEPQAVINTQPSPPHADELQAAVSFMVANNIFVGDNSGNLHLDKSLTRAEMAALLVRINNAEAEVSGNYTAYAACCGFTDGPAWAQGYVGYCVSQGLVNGYSAATYGAGDKVSYNAWCTVILRWLGHAETDWSYATATDKAASLGLLTDKLTGSGNSSANRGEVAKITYRAMN